MRAQQLKKNYAKVLDRESIGTRFLKSKFGDMECKYHCYKDHRYIESDLKEILDEFQMIIEAKGLVEAQNPRTKQFILMDKSKGLIIGCYSESFFNKS